MAQAPGRRARTRIAMIEEIKHTARRTLIQQGPGPVSLRAVARAMGMTAPALYRYFDSHEELLESVSDDLIAELSGSIAVAVAQASRSADSSTITQLIVACREFRRWSLAHRAEFGLLFGTPPGPSETAGHLLSARLAKFAGTFLGLFIELWEQQPFPVPEPGDIDPGLREQIEIYGKDLQLDLPPGAVLIFLRCWTRLYGAVSLEVFGHLTFALDDAAPMFDFTIHELGELLSLRDPSRPPGR